jgi:serine protease Do
MKRTFNVMQATIFSLAVAGLLAAGVAAMPGKSDKSDPATARTDTVSHPTKSAPAVSPEQAAQAVAGAKGLSLAFRAAADKVLPAVVTIENSPVVAARAENDQQNPGEDRNPFEGTPFGDMFRDRPFGKQFKFHMPPGQPGPSEGGMGSGVIFDTSGLILTNNHVAGGNGGVTVRLNDGREFKAQQVWTDPKTDIAVVKIDAPDLVAAKLGDSDEISVGDWVLALGQPFGLESTVTAGIISAKHRGIGITARENFLQTDAAINPGNSGGPLVNLDGEVVGINTAISSRSGGNEGIGFAVPVNLAKWVATQLADGGTVRRAYLGVGIQPVTQQLANQFHVKPREGVVVTEVYPNTPAAKAGLKSGDVIVEFGGIKVANPVELQTTVESAAIGKLANLRIMRDGKRLELKLKAEEQPNDFGPRGKPMRESGSPESPRMEKLGLELGTLDAAVAERLDLKGVEGVVVTDVRPNSPASRAGLEAGLVITQINRASVHNLSEATKALQDESPAQQVLLLVRNKAGSRFVVLGD